MLRHIFVKLLDTKEEDSGHSQAERLPSSGEENEIACDFSGAAT